MPHSTRTIDCVHCNRTITKRMPPAQIYCSRQCSLAARKKPRETRICQTCNRKFDFRQSPSSRPNAGKYCSIKCRILGTRTGYHPCPECSKIVDSQRIYCSYTCSLRGRAKNRRNGKEIKCDWCGKLFYLSKRRLENAKHYFCCCDHQIKWQGRHKHEFICKICGKQFRWSPSRIKQTNPTYCSIKCRDADPSRRKRLLKMNQQQQNDGPTKPEQIGYELLNDLGVDYQPQYLFKNKFCVDAFISRHNLIIQFDGNYWHGHPKDFPNPDNRQRRRMAYDKSQDAYMKACGYHVIRIWESNLKYSIVSVRDSLQVALDHIEQNPSSFLLGHLEV